MKHEPIVKNAHDDDSGEVLIADLCVRVCGCHRLRRYSTYV